MTLACLSICLMAILVLSLDDFLPVEGVDAGVAESASSSSTEALFFRSSRSGAASLPDCWKRISGLIRLLGYLCMCSIFP